MTNNLPDRWASQDFPVLRRTAEILEVEHADEARAERVAVDPGIDPDDVLRSMLALYDSSYVTGIPADSMAGRYVILDGLTERGRRAVGIYSGRINL